MLANHGMGNGLSLADRLLDRPHVDVAKDVPDRSLFARAGPIEDSTPRGELAAQGSALHRVLLAVEGSDETVVPLRTDAPREVRAMSLEMIWLEELPLGRRQIISARRCFRSLSGWMRGNGLAGELAAMLATGDTRMLARLEGLP
jgi:hypothetical protein